MIDPSIRLDRRAAACMECERAFAEGESIVSTIRVAPGDADEAVFERRDLCEDCFAKQGGAEGVHSLWRSRQPVRTEDPHRVDFELAGRFLERLLTEADPDRAGLAWVLALLLARKRRVKLHERREPDGRRLVTIVLRRPEDDLEVDLAVPAIGPDDVDRLQRELAALFGFAEPEPEPDTSAAEPEPSAGEPEPADGAEPPPAPPAGGGDAPGPAPDRT